MKIGIIGGGLMGLSLGSHLAKHGAVVEIFEASPVVGGLVGSFFLPDGVAVDRFYHAILSSDSNLNQLCQELGIADQLRFKETRMGFFYSGSIHPMNNILDFLRFPPLGWIDRFRLGLTVLAAQAVRDWRSLEGVSVEKWLLGLSGKTTYENIWLPMLNAKFDGGFADTPATYIWSRLVRMKSTRKGAVQKEQAGHLVGGYMTLIHSLADQIQRQGGKIWTNTPINKVALHAGRAIGLVTGDEFQPFDLIISTLPPPTLQTLLPDAPQEYRDSLGKMRYLGIICPLLVLDRPLSGYWTVNLTDGRLPFTGLIETTSYIDSSFVGGHHLVYLPKYIAPDSPYARYSDDQLRALWLEHLKVIFPDFQESWINYFFVFRERFVEPLHSLNGTSLIPSLETPLQGFYLASNAQIYPALTNGESITKKAREVADWLASRHALAQWS